VILDLLDGWSTALHVSDPRLVSGDAILTDSSAMGNVCKLGGTAVVIKAVGAFSALGSCVIFADGKVAVLHFFWLVLRRFCQIQRMGFLGGS